MEILDRRPELTRHGGVGLVKARGRTQVRRSIGVSRALRHGCHGRGCALSRSIPTRRFIRLDLGSQYTVDTGPADTEPAGYLDRPNSLRLQRPDLGRMSA